MENPYLKQINIVLPRLLALFDNDYLSPTYGVGDRFYWSWKLIDFGNGTFQGAANGLARLQAHGLLPEWLSNEAVDKRIEAMFIGADRLKRKNGSMEEAFPYESSFCVTALVAYDLLTSMELQKPRLSEKEWNKRLEIIFPMIEFLYKNDEQHAIISNHLATAVVALYKWYEFTKDKQAEIRGKEILDIILKHYSKEGWFKEYEGADPGYQTLCTYYLVDLHRIRPDLNLDICLKNSMNFLWNFAHPDGSFGGFYGSRNTRFFYPAGIEYLSNECEKAEVLSKFMRKSIEELTTVTLQTMDEPNLIPMFNAYAWAAVIFSANNKKKFNSIMPCLNKKINKIEFPEAGLYICGNKNHYTIISLKKGGVVYSYSRDGKEKMIDAGAIVEYKSILYSTQGYDKNLEFIEDESKGVVSVLVNPTQILHRYPSILEFITLRLLNLTIMRNVFIGNVIKKLLVKLLITKKSTLDYKIKREININGNIAKVVSSWATNEHPKNTSEIKNGRVFKSIHMASAGYWEKGDDI